MRTRDPFTPARTRAGMTLLEVTLAAALLAVVAIKVVGTLQSATEKSERHTSRTNLEAQAHRVLTRIAYAIMGSHPDSLTPDVTAPMASSSMRYQVSLGIANGELIWSDPERIAMEDETRNIIWTDRPEDDTGSRRVVWTSLVAPFLEGELPNGIDDNGNGLIDEKGLAFSIDGKTVEMHLTLEQVMDDGTSLVRTVTKTVSCRNLVEGWGMTE